MRIVCPSCATTYDIPEAAIGAGGRNVRCNRCATRWRVETTVEAEDEEAGAIVARSGAGAANAGTANAGTANAGTASVGLSGAVPSDVGPSGGPVARSAAATVAEPVTADLPFADEDDDEDDDADDDAVDDGATAAALPAAAAPVAASPPAPVDPHADAPAAAPTAAVGLAGLHAPSAAAAAAHHDIESLARPKIVVRRKPRPALTTRLREAASWLRSVAFRSRTAVGITVFALSLLLPGLGLALRVPIVRAFPRIAGLYAEIGLPVNLSGLEFRTISTLRELDNGQPVLVIEGAVANVTLSSLAMPSLRLALRGADGQEIYAWSVQPKTATVPAGDEVRFRSRLTAPPEDAVDVQLRFTEPKTRQAVLP